MKPTKTAKKNQARQKLKLESAIAIKEATQEGKILDNPTNIKSEIIFLIITLVFTGIMIFLMGAIRMNPFADNGGPYVKAEESFGTNYEDKGNAILEKHFVEGIKTDKNKQPSNEDYRKALSFNLNLLEYFNTANKTREDLSNNSNNDDKEIRSVRVVPAAGFETKENIFVDIVNYESDKQPSKDEIAESIKKESAFLLASENTEEGKLKLAAAERENQEITNKEPDANPTPTFIREHGISLFVLLYVMWGSLQYNDYRKDKKRRLVYEEDESQSENAPAILKINNNKDLTRYSNKL